ncbi:MAG: hypothetical protein ACRDZO_13835 [Egibacteraceae bacterium]
MQAIFAQARTDPGTWLALALPMLTFLAAGVYFIWLGFRSRREGEDDRPER